MSSNNKPPYVGWYAIANIWFGGVVGLPSILLGSKFIGAFTFPTILLVGLLGYSFVTGYMCLLSSKAVHYRVDTIKMASIAFGKNGANVLVGLIVGISLLGWFGVLTGIVGTFFTNTMSQMGIAISNTWSSMLWGIIMTIVSVLGFKYLKLLNIIAIPGILVLIAYSLWTSWGNESLSLILKHSPKEKIPLLQGVGMVIGLFSVGGLIAPDYNRFAISKKDAIWGSLIGLLPMGTTLLGVGAILAILCKTGDITLIFTRLGMPLLALTTLILITWTSNAMCIYSGGLSFTKAFLQQEKMRPLFSLLCGLAGSVLAVLGVLSKFTNILLILTATIPPIAGVIIGSYYRKDNPNQEAVKLYSINWKGIAAWMIGVAFMIFIPSDIKNIVGIIVSGLSYILIEKLYQYCKS